MHEKKGTKEQLKTKTFKIRSKSIDFKKFFFFLKQTHLKLETKRKHFQVSR